jgi:general stress protein YciG
MNSSSKLASLKGGAMARGNFGRKEQHKRAGELGGQETAKKGSEFYEDIGSKGGSNEENPGRFDNRSEEDRKRSGQKGGSAS